MSRIATPATIADAPLAAQPLLEAVKKQLGIVPNLFRVVSNSPAALE
ncbi:MAG: carboxymuconolactone decarboxylase family protein, partial [bacterium]